MAVDRRNESSIGARLRHEPTPIGWGAWGTSGRSAIATAPGAGGRKVLAVGASGAARQAWRDALASFDAQTVEAATLGEALRAVTETDFALVVLQLEPGQAGDPAVEALLRRAPRAPGTPAIFVLPAGATEEDVRAAYQAGAADCLVDAPLDIDVLRRKAIVYFEMQSARAALRAAIERAQAQDRALAALEGKLREQQDLLRQQATHDPLSGLPNRALFEDRLDGALRRARRSNQHVALAIVNLDGFRKINEQLGYSAGDELIVQTARRLVQAVRTSDTVARLGSDEFAVVLESLATASAADYLAHKLATAAAQPCTLLADPHGTPTQVKPRASLGIAIYPEHAREREELMTAADMTLKQVKRSGGGSLVYQGGVLVASEGVAPAAAASVVGRIPRKENG